MLHLFPVTFEQRTERSRAVWTELFWAEDADHAEEQAEAAHPGQILHIALVPDEYVQVPE